MKPFDPDNTKTMNFFSLHPPEEILGSLATLLDKLNYTYTISSKSWKLRYSTVKVLQPFELEAEKGIQELKEQATIQVEILDASDGMICVEFSRVGGSSSLFYQ